MAVEKMIEDETREIRGQPTISVGKMNEPIPPLKHGDKLTRDEFHRRYEMMPEDKKAELIEGVVYIAPPVRSKSHGEPHACAMAWLGSYRAATPGVDAANSPTVRLDVANEVQPDALLRLASVHGGNSHISDDGYLNGAPELIVEVEDHDTNYDAHDKFEIYRRNGVEEYIRWQTEDKQLDWFRLVEGAYIPLTPDANGVVESQVFPGLRLKVGALLGGDLVGVLSELQQGLDTAEHTAFVDRLSQA